MEARGVNPAHPAFSTKYIVATMVNPPPEHAGEHARRGALLAWRLRPAWCVRVFVRACVRAKREEQCACMRVRVLCASVSVFTRVLCVHTRLSIHIFSHKLRGALALAQARGTHNRGETQVNCSFESWYDCAKMVCALKIALPGQMGRRKKGFVPHLAGIQLLAWCVVDCKWVT